MSTTGEILDGAEWTATIIGRNSLNGARYQIEMHGDANVTEPKVTVYDLARYVTERLQRDASEMELAECLVLAIHPKQFTR